MTTKVKIRTPYDELIDDYSKAKRERADAINSLRGMADACRGLRTKNARLRERITQLENEPTRGTNAKLRERIRALMDAAPEVEKTRREVEMSELRGVAQGLQNELVAERLRTQITPAAHDALRGQVASLKGQVAALTSNREVLRDQLGEQRSLISSLKGQVAALTSNREVLRDQLGEQRSLISRLTASNVNLDNTLECTFKDIGNIAGSI